MSTNTEQQNQQPLTNFIIKLDNSFETIMLITTLLYFGHNVLSKLLGPTAHLLLHIILHVTVGKTILCMVLVTVGKPYDIQSQMCSK